MKESFKILILALTGIAVASVWFFTLHEVGQSHGGICGDGKVLVRGVIGLVCVEKGS